MELPGSCWINDSACLRMPDEEALSARAASRLDVSWVPEPIREEEVDIVEGLIARWRDRMECTRATDDTFNGG